MNREKLINLVKDFCTTQGVFWSGEYNEISKAHDSQDYEILPSNLLFYDNSETENYSGLIDVIRVGSQKFAFQKLIRDPYYGEVLPFTFADLTKQWSKFLKKESKTKSFNDLIEKKDEFDDIDIEPSIFY